MRRQVVGSAAALLCLVVLVSRAGPVVSYPQPPCPPGKYVDVLSNEDKCLECPMDTFNAVPGAESCIACPEGTSTVGLEGATSVAACRSTETFNPDSLPRSQSLGGGAEIKW